MLKLKIYSAMVVLSAVLAFGTPAMVKASDMYQTPPAIVFMQDKDGMMLRHNFTYDNGMMIYRSPDGDKGFYVDNPLMK